MKKQYLILLAVIVALLIAFSFYKRPEPPRVPKSHPLDTTPDIPGAIETV